MRSSTSSFDRPVPELPWLKMAAVALTLAVAASAVWEVQARRMGYEPCLNDTPDLWAVNRDRVDSDSVVIIGSSRTVFDLDLEVMENSLGTRPIHLGVVGSCPRPMLEHLVADESFRGTILVGVTPGLFFAPGGPLVDKSHDWLKYYRDRSPSQRSGAALARWLEMRLAFLKQEDLTLEMLLGRIQLPNRAKATVPPRLPPYMGPTMPWRSMLMSERLATDPAFQAELQGIWKGILESIPPMEPEVVEQIRQGLLAETAGRVAALRERGVEVVFLRLPSTGFFREVEAVALPRETYWDALLEATGALGIHFEDHEELSGYDCPEWSHLNAEDATSYTRAMMPILESWLRDGGRS